MNEQNEELARATEHQRITQEAIGLAHKIYRDGPDKPEATQPVTASNPVSSKDDLGLHAKPISSEAPPGTVQQPAWGDTLPDGTKVGYTQDTLSQDPASPQPGTTEDSGAPAVNTQLRPMSRGEQFVSFMSQEAKRRGYKPEISWKDCPPEIQAAYDQVTEDLVDGFRRQANAWQEDAERFARNEEFYRGIVEAVAAHLGPHVFIADDGGYHDSVLALKVEPLVAVYMTRLAQMSYSLRLLGQFIIKRGKNASDMAHLGGEEICYPKLVALIMGMITSLEGQNKKLRGYQVSSMETLDKLSQEVATLRGKPSAQAALNEIFRMMTQETREAEPEVTVNLVANNLQVVENLSQMATEVEAQRQTCGEMHKEYVKAIDAIGTFIIGKPPEENATYHPKYVEDMVIRHERFSTSMIDLQEARQKDVLPNVHDLLASTRAELSMLKEVHRSYEEAVRAIGLAATGEEISMDPTLVRDATIAKLTALRRQDPLLYSNMQSAISNQQATITSLYGERDSLRDQLSAAQTNLSSAEARNRTLADTLTEVEQKSEELKRTHTRLLDTAVEEARWEASTKPPLLSMNRAEVVFGLMAWLTCRAKTITLGSGQECSEAAQLADAFIKANELGECSDAWGKEVRVIYPHEPRNPGDGQA